jgi:hypothetical protein
MHTCYTNTYVHAHTYIHTYIYVKCRCPHHLCGWCTRNIAAYTQFLHSCIAAYIKTCTHTYIHVYIHVQMQVSSSLLRMVYGTGFSKFSRDTCTRAHVPEEAAHSKFVRACMRMCVFIIHAHVLTCQKRQPTAYSYVHV